MEDDQWYSSGHEKLRWTQRRRRIPVPNFEKYRDLASSRSTMCASPNPSKGPSIISTR